MLERNVRSRNCDTYLVELPILVHQGSHQMAGSSKGCLLHQTLPPYSYALGLLHTVSHHKYMANLQFDLPPRGFANIDDEVKLARVGTGREPGAVAPGRDCDKFDVYGESVSSRSALLPR